MHTHSLTRRCFLALTPEQSFATYLLIAWLTSNIIFAKVVSIVCALEWEVRRPEGGGGAKGAGARTNGPHCTVPCCSGAMPAGQRGDQPDSRTADPLGVPPCPPVGMQRGARHGVRQHHTGQDQP